MRAKKGRGGILRLRPGHLANFSGGAGYMPFVILFSVPASFIFAVIGWVVLQVQGTRLLQPSDGERIPLHRFVQYARWHALGCVIVALLAGIILFSEGQSMVYGNKWQYAVLTAVYACGPIAAWLLSSFLMIWLIAKRGAGWTNLAASIAAYAILLAACIPLAILVTATVEAR